MFYPFYLSGLFIFLLLFITILFIEVKQTDKKGELLWLIQAVQQQEKN